MSGGQDATILERRIAADADDAAARYELAILLLDEYSGTGEPQLLDRAREHLTRAVARRPAHAPSHAALGYTHACTDTGLEQALACFREARRLNARDTVGEVYVLTLLASMGREDEALAGIEAAAPRHGVDLGALRSDLARVGFPADASTLLANGFIRAESFYRSALAERIRNALDPARGRRAAATERARCLEEQQHLERSFDASRVPEPLRPLASWASRYGIGDDCCRPLLIKGLTPEQRAQLVREVDEHAGTIEAWLNSFAEGQMTIEAGAFLFLAEGVEEIR
jgi:hypothetical protein